MICQKCIKEFQEKDIHESHDVPSYIFSGERKIRKQKADKYGRHHVCQKCHDIYEKTVFSVMVNQADNETKKRMIKSALKFTKEYFNEDGDTKSVE